MFNLFHQKAEKIIILNSTLTTFLFCFVGLFNCDVSLCINCLSIQENPWWCKWGKLITLLTRGEISPTISRAIWVPGFKNIEGPHIHIFFFFFFFFFFRARFGYSCFFYTSGIEMRDIYKGHLDPWSQNYVGLTRFLEWLVEPAFFEPLPLNDNFPEVVIINLSSCKTTFSSSLKVHSSIFQNLIYCFIWRIIPPKV